MTFLDENHSSSAQLQGFVLKQYYLLILVIYISSSFFHNNWAISCSLIGWWAMVFDIVDHGNEVMMAHFVFVGL